MGLIRDGCDRPGQLGGREWRVDRRDDRGSRRDDRQDNRMTGEMIGATGVPDPLLLR